jgi:hypothetical protein
VPPITPSHAIALQRRTPTACSPTVRMQLLSALPKSSFSEHACSPSRPQGNPHAPVTVSKHLASQHRFAWAFMLGAISLLQRCLDVGALVKCLIPAFSNVAHGGHGAITLKCAGVFSSLQRCCCHRPANFRQEERARICSSKLARPAPLFVCPLSEATKVLDASILQRSTWRHTLLFTGEQNA